MKIKPDRLCRICNTEYKNLSQHIRQTHKISDYKAYYDKYVKSKNEEICPICGKDCNFVSVMYGYHDHCSTKCSNNSAEVKKKKQRTSQLHYGVDNPNQSKIVRDRIEKTLNERYGVSVPLHSDEIKQRAIETSRRKYGTDYSSQNKKTREKYRATCMLKFGVDNPSKTFKARLKSRQMLIDRIEHENGNQIRPMRGGGEKECFDELERYIDFEILRDVSKIGYFPDGYVEELKLVIEFDEPEHQTRTWYREHDAKRDADFNLINHVTYRIKQTDWLSDKDRCIKEFQIFCEGLADSKENLRSPLLENVL